MIIYHNYRRKASKEMENKNNHSFKLSKYSNVVISGEAVDPQENSIKF